MQLLHAVGPNGREKATAGGKCGVKGGFCKMCDMLICCWIKERQSDAPAMKGTVIAVRTLRRKKKTESSASEV